MNHMDRILHRQLPTMMVPKYEELSPCDSGKTRFLMTGNGLFVEAVQSFGVFRKCLWPSPRRLPYGDVEERDDLTEALSNSTVRDLIRTIVMPEAAKYAEDGNREWAGWITWNPETGYRFMPLDFDAQTSAVSFVRPELPEGTFLAVDIHSHGTLSPYFSPVDNYDDAGGVRLCVVIGDYRPGFGFSLRNRVIVEGFFFD